MSRKIFFSLLIPAVLSLSGCGYRLTSNPDFSSVITGKKVAIPVFTNRSYRANVGAIMAGSLVDEFARRSGGKVVGENAADLVLAGKILSYASDAVSYTAADKVKEYRTVIAVEATLTEKNTHKVVWKGVLSWSQVYPVNTNYELQQSSIVSPNSSTALQNNIALQQNNEEAAIREICAHLAQQIYERVTAGF